MKKLHELIATGLYVGYFPLAPGTFASFTVGLSVWIYNLAFGYGTAEKIIVLLLVSAAGLVSTSVTLRYTNIKDPGYIVIDEWAGQLTTYLWVPINMQNILIGFVLFRIFDILKVYPVNRAERLRGAYGVMLDDIVAGLYAGFLLFGWNYLSISPII